MTTDTRTKARQPARQAPVNVEQMADDLPPVREPAREATRQLRPGEFLGRNGEILALKRNPDANLFDIPKHLCDPNYSYEWKRYVTMGKDDITHQVQLAENGWRPVLVEPGSPWSGYYMPAEYTGPIKREDLMLMERPLGMTHMVREQERQRARSQMSNNTDRYNSRKAVDTPQGFTTMNPNVPSSVSTSYDVGPAPAKHDMPIE